MMIPTSWKRSFRGHSIITPSLGKECEENNSQPIESEFSFSAGLFLNNNDVSDRKPFLLPPLINKFDCRKTKKMGGK